MVGEVCVCGVPVDRCHGCERHVESMRAVIDDIGLDGLGAILAHLEAQFREEMGLTVVLQASGAVEPL